MRGALVVAALALPSGAPAFADVPPAGSTWSEGEVTSSDGTRLHADVFRPADASEGEVTPAMLVVSPYLGTPSAEPPKVLAWYRRLYEEAIARRYSVVQVSFRGTGSSQGCGDFGGPGEQADVAAAIEWAASQPWSTGRVGMLGHSYDGTAAVMALARRPRALAAAVVAAPAVDLYRGAYMNGVGYLQTPVIAAYYQGLALVPPLHDPGEGIGAVTSSDPTCASRTVPPSQDPDRGSAFWRERDFAERAAGGRIPVLWSHGFLDGRDDYSSVRPDNFLDLWRRLDGPRRAWFGQFPHLVPGELNTWNEAEPVGRDGFPAEALDWLDAYVKGDERALAAVRGQPPVAVQEGASGGWRSEPVWPPASVRRARLPILAGSYEDGPGTKAEQGDGPGGSCSDGIHARCNPNSRTGQGSWTFSEPLGEDVHVAGPARMRVRVAASTPAAHLVALVYDVDRSNRATLLTRGASLVGGGDVDFELYPQDWRLAAGHRVGVLLAGSDDFYFAPGTSGSAVGVSGGELELPLLAAPPGPELPGEPSRAVKERTSFPVSAEALSARSAPLALPALPASRNGRLALRVRPRRVRAGRTVSLRLRTVDRHRRAVPHARVRVGRALLRTSARGTLRAKVRFTRPGRRVVRASKPGYARARAFVRVRR